MPDVSSSAPVDVQQWIVFDVHKNSLVAGTLPAAGGTPEVTRLENTERAVRRFVDRLGGPGGLAVAYEAGPCGYDLLRLLSRMGVACDVIAPSLVPVRAGDRVKTDRRDAKKLVRLYRAGELSFVDPPSPAQEGLRDLVRCRDDLRRARTAARHRVGKQLLRHGHIYREGKKSWTLSHKTWVAAQRLADPLAQRALEHMRAHLDTVDAQLAAIDHELEQVATSEPWCDPVRWLCSFRGIGLITALGLLAEIGDFRRFGHPRELMSYLGLTPSEYSSGDQQHRGHITKTGNRHARRLLVEAAWHYRHHPRVSQRAARAGEHVPPEISARAWQAQIRLHHRHRTLTQHGKRSTVANVAVARELAGFIWAAMTDQPLRDEAAAAA
ncbi:MAG: IS110 family transposase [Actinobacteria bacterium]|nr:IS110 family transposase [Actinomycetota bacterium]